MKQTVAHKKLNTVQGIGLIAALVAALILINYLVIDVLAAKIGPTAATIGFWLIGGALALTLLRVFVVRYTYETNGDVLRLTRSYGKRERFIEDVYLSRVRFVGSFEEAKKRSPNASVVRAVRKSDKLPVTAVLYRDSKGERIALLQANEELKAELAAAGKEKK